MHAGYVSPSRTRAADAIAYYAKAFGAQESFRMPGPEGKLMHAAITLNGATLTFVANNNFGASSSELLGAITLVAARSRWQARRVSRSV